MDWNLLNPCLDLCLLELLPALLPCSNSFISRLWSTFSGRSSFHPGPAPFNGVEIW
jgi:hypothetical protein